MSQNRRTKTLGYQTRWWVCFLLCGLTLFLSGCGSGTTRKTSSVNRSKKIQTSAIELTARNQSVLALYSSEIEGAADKVILESPSPAARRQALMWKSEAIPVLQTSLLNTDPVVAVFDTWAFVFQMTAYIDQPAVKNQFGALQPVFTDTFKRMDGEMEQLVLTAAPSADIPHLRQKIGAWAAAHPIQAGLAGRRSADAELIEQADQSDLGALGSLKALQEGLGDITARLDSYNTYLPKQARWQAELLLSDATHDPEVNAAAVNFAVVSRALEKTSNTVEHMPELADQARAALLADVEGQRLAAQSFLRAERLQTLDSLTQQRIDAVADLRGERLAATADLRGERQIVLDTLHNQEVAMVNDMHTLSEQTAKDFDARSRSLIDRLFRHAIELMLIALVLCTLAAWILLRRIASKRSADDHQTSLDRAA
jgi:hypothetical protein